MYIVQEDGRLYRGERYPYKQLCNPALIFSFTLGRQKELTAFDPEKLTFKSLNFERRRQVNLWNKFEKGRYAIIPCKMKNNIVETDFEFRIYSEKSKKISITKLRGHHDFKTLQELTNPEIDSSQYSSLITLLGKQA